LHEATVNLINRRVIELRVVALTIAVVQKMVVDQVPAPALPVAAQQRHVTVTLHRSRKRGDTYNGNGAERTLPPHLPAMSAVPKADFSARGVRTLRDRVAMQREAVRFHVNVPRAVVRVPRVIKRAQFRLVRRHVGEQVRFERLFGELAYAVQPPYVVVFVVQKSIPICTH